MRADAVISAVGQLNRPRHPDIPGLDRFKGTIAHTGAWPQDLAWEGKRIAVIGTGASAFQLVPAIAPKASHVTVFQRSPVWMFPNAHYHEGVSAEHQWVLRHVPYYGRWLRFLLFYPGSDAMLPVWTADPTWPHPERAVNERNDLQREQLTAWIASQVGDDPELLAKVVPDYPVGGKRILQDNGSWLGALKRPDVELVTEKIASIDETAVIDASGRRHEVDVIALATGFYADRFLAPMQIIGRGGADLRAQWGDEPAAYLGITVPGFPNLYCLYGPGTNLAHAGSIIFHSECQVRYVLGCLRQSIEHGAPLECRADSYQAYTGRLRRRARADGLVAPRRAQLVPERPRRGRHDFALAAGRLLALDARAGSRGLRARTGASHGCGGRRIGGSGLVGLRHVRRKGLPACRYRYGGSRPRKRARSGCGLRHQARSDRRWTGRAPVASPGSAPAS